MKKAFFVSCLALLPLAALALGACKAQPKDITVTFEGGKCTYSGPEYISTGMISVNWEIVGHEGESLTLGAVNLAGGKTDADLDQLMDQFMTSPAATQIPDWLIILWGWSGASTEYPHQVNLYVQNGPVYFVCYSAGASIQAAASQAVDVRAPSPLPTITPHSAPAASANPIPVIIDTDMAADDWMAILYLLQRPDIDVLAITVAGTGEAHCGPGVKNAYGLALLSGRYDIPVACGRETPLQGDHVFPEGWRTWVDSLGGLTLPTSQNPGEGMSAVELLTSALDNANGKVTILTLGPLTNLADALQTDPGIAGKIEGVYVMGGAVNVPGNVSDSGATANMVAEYNIYIDPYAANVVFSSSAPVTLVPLDATNQVPFTQDFYLQLQASQLTAEARFLFAVIDGNKTNFLSGGYYFWDPLAAGILSDNSLAAFQEMPICVVEEEGSQSGRTQERTDCPMLRVATAADGDRFIQIFLDTLNNP
jgi:inosine-uridine nucleoside N-ribohydrolase